MIRKMRHKKKLEREVFLRNLDNIPDSSGKQAKQAERARVQPKNEFEELGSDKCKLGNMCNNTENANEEDKENWKTLKKGMKNMKITKTLSDHSTKQSSMRGQLPSTSSSSSSSSSSKSPSPSSFSTSSLSSSLTRSTSSRSSSSSTRSTSSRSSLTVLESSSTSTSPSSSCKYYCSECYKTCFSDKESYSESSIETCNCNSSSSDDEN